MADPIKLVIIDDRLPLSIARDLVSIGTLTAAVGLGVWLDSVALQWIAGILWILIVIGKGLKLKEDKYTIAQARTKLDELEKAGGA